LTANELLKKQLSTKLAAPKTQKKPQLFFPVIGKDAERENISVGPSSYRTKSRVAEYRKAGEKARLDIRVDAKAVLRPRAVVTPRRRVQ
jgi:hypothetical protein